MAIDSDAIPVCAPIKPNGMVVSVVVITPVQRQRAATEAVGEPSSERHHERDAQALRRHEQAGVEDALMADSLPVER